MSWILLGIPIGIILLYLGSEWMVDGAKKMALRLGVTPFVVGLTVVAFGSSSPELITSLVSGDNPQIILGNIVGSNIANVGLAIGLAAIISPIVCKFTAIKFELGAMMFAVVMITVMALTGSLGFVEGAILLSALAVFIYFVYTLKKKDPENADSEVTEEDIFESASTPVWKCMILVIIGIVALYFGARAFIGGAVEIAEIFGVSDLLIGLLVVAIGVSLPELCVCIVAAYRKENEIVVSNIVGSIVFNCFFALGVGILFTTVPVTHYAMVFHMPVMILIAALMLIMVKFNKGVSRSNGAILVAIYAAYVSAMIIFPQLTEGIV
jgi:K+-dependent Na+/Ca+ exchanger related-protein